MNLLLKRSVRVMALLLLLVALGSIAYVKAGRGRMEEGFPSRREGPQVPAEVASPSQAASRSESSGLSTSVGAESLPQRKSPTIPLGSVALWEAGRFWEDAGAFSCQFSTFAAAFNGDRLEMRLRDDSPGSEAQLTLKLDTISIGERVIARGDGQVRPTCSEDRRSISYARNGVEEKYIASDSALEQVFVITESPESKDAITVTQTVETSFEPPADGAAADKIRFTRQGKEVFFISDAVAIDAGGRRLKLPLSFRKGILTLTVPAEWVKEATFPLTIDPLVGTPVTIVASTPDLGVNQKVSAAYNSSSNEWLVTYPLWAGSNPGYNVYARRISSAGALLGSQITVASNNKNDYLPTVAYAPSPINRYLVAWTQLTTLFPVLSGRILNGDGTFFAAQFQIANPPFGTSDSCVAYDGSNWCVMYDSNDGIDYYMKARFISPTGVLGILVSLESGGFNSSVPRLMFGSGTYTALWSKRMNGSGFAEYNALGRTFLPDGSFVSGVVTVVGDVNQSTGSISVGGGKIFHSNGAGGTIRNSSWTVEIGPFATQGGGSSAFSSTTNEWLQISFAPDPANPANPELWGRNVSLTGNVSSPSRITYNLDATENLGALSWNSTNNVMLVCFLRGNPPSLLAQRVSMNPPVAPAAPAAFAGVVQSSSAIAWSWGNVADESGFDLHDTSEISRGLTWPDVLSFTETNLPENTAVTRHVHAFSDYIYGSSSNSATVRTKVHDPTTSDFYLSVISSTQINVVVTPPPDGGNPGSTGCKIERQNGNKWTLLQNFTANYTYLDNGRSPNTSYTYRITFQNGAGVPTAVSPTQSITTSAPAIPGSFAGTVQTGSAILWSWADVSNENNFLLHGPGEVPETSVARNVLSFLEGGLAENTPLTRHLHAVNGVGQSAATASVTKTTFIHDPTASDFALVLTTPTSITVTVTQPPNPGVLLTGCQIQRSVDNQNWSILKDFGVSGYSATDSPLTNGATYYYRFRYQNADGVITPFSPTQSRTASLVPVITTGNKKTRNPNTTIQGTGIVGSLVTVYFNGSGEAGQATVNANGSWSYAVATKSEGVYTVTARATLGGPPSGDSNAITVTIDLTGPAPPSNIRIAGYNNTIDVLWDSSPSSDVAGYQVSRKLGPGGPWNILNTSQLILGNQYRDSTPLNGQQYFYRVTAVDDALSD